MPYLTIAEINSHLYAETSDEISRENNQLLTDSIAAAIAEATGYLNKYDVGSIFLSTGADRNPILLLYVKDCAVWHFINISSSNVDTDFRQLRYEKAIDWFRGVQKGTITPDLPPPPVDPTDEQLNNTVRWGNARARQSGFL